MGRSPPVFCRQEAGQHHGRPLFELEVETAEPDAVKAALEGLLRARGIDFSYSTVSKFANFVRGTLD